MRIRRVSIDKFYEIVTGEPDAFYQLCMVLPDMVSEVLRERVDGVEVPRDSVYQQMRNMASGFHGMTDDMAMVLSMYMLGFSTYNGFNLIGNS